MRTWNTLTSFFAGAATADGAPFRGSAVALGFFDGVHLGHRAVLNTAVCYAGAYGLTPAAFTFSLPAGNTLKGGRILSNAQKQARIGRQGIAYCLEPPFESFCALSPEDFVQTILVGCLGAKAVFCGDNFTFGAHAAGDVALLRALCAQAGITVQVVAMAQYAGQTVSSTRIRAALEEGRLADANAMLGDPYAIDWPVAHGQQIGSTKLGAPTINQHYPAGTLMPASGVYITRARVGGQWYAGATGLGRRPTITDEGAVTCETFLPDYHGPALYGTAPLLEFHRYLEPVRRYNSLEELKACIFDAAAKSRAYFAAL